MHINFKLFVNNRSLTLESSFLFIGGDFEIIFKCMSGFTTSKGKFIMPLDKKMSHDDSIQRCNSFGITFYSYDKHKLCCITDEYWLEYNILYNILYTCQNEPLLKSRSSDSSC